MFFKRGWAGKLLCKLVLLSPRTKAATVIHTDQLGFTRRCLFFLVQARVGGQASVQAGVYIHVSIYLFIYLSIYLCLSIYIYIQSLSTYVYIRYPNPFFLVQARVGGQASLQANIYMYISLSISLSLSTHLSIYVYVFLSI